MNRRVADLEVEAAPNACLNCGALLVGRHCHDCGQRAHVHHTMGAFLHDLVHGVLHFEGKFWRTVPLLLFKPGELTRRYVQGERARFLSPIGLFLFSMFVMFAVVNLTGAHAYRDQRPAEVRQRSGGGADIDNALNLLPGFRTWIGEPLAAARKESPLLAYKFQSNAYKYSWALIPLSLPFVWLLFVNRGRYRERFGALHHLAFITYSLSFMTLWVVAYTGLKLLGMIGPIALLPFVAVPLHMYAQLRGAYGLSRVSAAWRTAALLLSAALVSGMFLGGLLRAGALT